MNRAGIKPQVTIGSLFADAGGLELGLERAIPGARTVWQVEIDPFCRQILAEHWPHAEHHDDVRTFPTPETSRVDIICGGFPCQDISSAGVGAGLDGERSGLFFEFMRVVRQLRPDVVVLENVAALLDRGFGRVLGALAELGFDAEWSCVSACSVGAPHMRDRLFVVAYADRLDGKEGLGIRPRDAGAVRQERNPPSAGVWLEPASRTHRVVDGVHRRLDGDADRLRALGNAVVPQVAEVIGARVAALLGGGV